MAPRAPAVTFKPIQQIDPEQSRAAQLARRGPGLAVKFPRLDWDNLPSWPPLSDEEDEDDEIGDEDDEIGDEDDEIGDDDDDDENANRKEEEEIIRLGARPMIPPPPSSSNASQLEPPRAPSRPQPSAAPPSPPRRRREAPPRSSSTASSEAQLDCFVPKRRKCPAHPPRRARGYMYFASRPLRDGLAPSSSNNHNPPVACPVPLSSMPMPSLPPASPNRRPRAGGEASPGDNNNPFPPIPGAHRPGFSRVAATPAATPSVRFATRPQSRPVDRGNSQFNWVGGIHGGGADGNAISSRGASAVRQAANEPSLSSNNVPTNAPHPAPARIIQMAPAGPRRAGENNRPRPAPHSTFRMAVALSKPYRLGSHAPPNYQLLVVSGNSIHLVPGAHAAFDSAEPTPRHGLEAHVPAVRLDRDPPAGRNANSRPLSTPPPANLGGDRPMSPEYGPPRHSDDDVSSVDDDVPLGLGDTEHSDDDDNDNDGSDLADFSPRIAALLKGTRENDDDEEEEERTVGMSPAAMQRQQEEQQQTNLPVNRPQKTPAPVAVAGQQTAANSSIIEMSSQPWLGLPPPRRDTTTRPEARSMRRFSLHRPPVHNGTNRQIPRREEPVVPAAASLSRPRESAPAEGPKKRRRIVVKQEEGEERSMPLAAGTR